MAKFNKHINQSWSLQSMPFGNDDSRLNIDGIYLPLHIKAEDIRI